jgi:hypothetical protein
MSLKCRSYSQLLATPGPTEKLAKMHWRMHGSQNIYLHAAECTKVCLSSHDATSQLHAYSTPGPKPFKCTPIAAAK